MRQAGVLAAASSTSPVRLPPLWESLPVTRSELALRRRIMAAFAATGEAPELAPADAPILRRLAERHVVALDGEEILMAHPFAAHRDGARVRSGERTWLGNCAWDALGIVAALGLRDARVTSGDVALDVVGGDVAGEALFHVLVPARHWWDDIGFT
jgi:hypothetical protein